VHAVHDSERRDATPLKVEPSTRKSRRDELPYVDAKADACWFPDICPRDVKKRFFTFLTFVSFFKRFFSFFKKTLARFRAASKLIRITFKITATK